MKMFPVLEPARRTRALVAIVAASFLWSAPETGASQPLPAGSAAHPGVPGQSPAQPPAAPVAQPAADGGAEAVVRALYGHVTFSAGKNVDWQKVKDLFIPEAAIVLRTSRTSMTVFDRDGFVDDFVKFIAQAKLEDQAFEETVAGIRVEESGDMARAIVHYVARIPSAGRPGQHGIDAFLLMKKDGAWKIVSVVNEIVRPGVEVPEDIRSPE